MPVVIGVLIIGSAVAWRARHRNQNRSRRGLVLPVVAIVALLSPAFPDVAAAEPGAWVQLGDDLFGEVVGDEFGRAVAMSDDGRTVAVGAPIHDGVTGHVRVYRFDGSMWAQLGTDIEAEEDNDFSGQAVAMSADGSTVAIGAEYNNNFAGHVRVYQFDGSDWVQVGSDIDGEAPDTYSGGSVALSDDGATVAIGAIFNEGSGGRSGHVRVYRLDAGDWVQLGADIDGEAPGDWFGHAVVLSGDGNTVAVGAPNNDGAAIFAGHVRVLRFEGGTWTQVGTDIDGGRSEGSGSAVAMSADASTVAIGAGRGRDNAGQVRVYGFDGGDWAQIGDTVSGEADGDRSGIYVAMSRDGRTIAASGIFNDSNGEDSGHVRVHRYDGTEWARVGADIDGRAAEDTFGYSVAMSGDGATVAAGAPQSRFGHIGTGYVGVYTFDEGAPGSALDDRARVFLTNVASGRFLDGDGTHRSWNVDTSPEGLFDARWKLIDNGDGTWSLLNRRRNRYLDADRHRDDFNVNQSVRLKADDKWEFDRLPDGSFTVYNTAYRRFLHEAPDHNVDTVTRDAIDDNARWIVTPVR